MNRSDALIAVIDDISSKDVSQEPLKRIADVVISPPENGSHICIDLP